MNLPEFGYTPLNLIMFMATKKISGQQVADALKVHKNTVSHWRTGLHTMPHGEWTKLLSIFSEKQDDNIKSIDYLKSL